MHVIARSAHDASPFEDAPPRAEDTETWAELCRWGAAAIVFLGLTGAVAALILACLENM
jgi:hypothetical protein